MEKFADMLLDVVSGINSSLSNYILIILLVSVGLYYTFRTKFVQIRCFGEGIKSLFGNFSMNGGKQNGGLSSFQALTASIAAQVGTGNVVGACAAILIGGPGAIFWMWVLAFLSMATIYGEAVLAQQTRVVNEDGSVLGGPIYYIKKAFKGRFGKFLAIFFAVSATIALGFTGLTVQSNSISQSCQTAFNIPVWVTGIVIAVCSAFVFVGGISRIGTVCEKIVPVMAGLYILGSLAVLIINIKDLPQSFVMIFKYAFSARSVIGGSVGSAIYLAVTQGAKKGLFSNEAGMGSTPHAHAQANVKRPHEQGVMAMIAVFIDTFVILTLTSLVVISTLFVGDGALNPENFSVGQTLGEVAGALGLTSTNLAQTAFGTAFGSAAIGNIFVAVCLLFFAFSTIIGWNLFARINANYLFGKKFLGVFSIISVIFIFLGSVMKNELVWELTDMFNNLMVIPNVLALFVLGKHVFNEAKSKKKSKETTPKTENNENKETKKFYS